MKRRAKRIGRFWARASKSYTAIADQMSKGWITLIISQVPLAVEAVLLGSDLGGRAAMQALESARPSVRRAAA
jgi:hypothetical protein